MTKFSWLSQDWQLKLVGNVAIVGTLLAAVGESVLAQIVPDDTLGAEGSIVTPDVNIQGIQGDRIDGGATRGANLFHSFQEFNVGEGRGAYFANPTGIENILTRVTGGNPSNILGRLGVLGEANLFLLNPNGIVFGSNASLDIQGSFVATTAERIKLGDSGYFSAVEPQTTSLLSVSPGALFFSEVANQPSSIINQGNLATGQHLTLRADNLDLQGQLLSGGDLTLQAQDTVKVRDSAAIPFIASAGGNLLVQGNQGIDIAALSHPYSGLFAGGNLVLRSDQTVGGDARFWSGGNFSTERLDGSLGNLYSPHDPIILSNGDVTLGNYRGASLHILAGGSVTLGNVTITRTGAAATTINPTNTNLFNGSRTYADLATVDLTDYKATLNSDGSVRSVDPVLVPLVIDGSTRATLDVRAGVDWAALGGLPTNPVLLGTVPPPTVSNMATSADITVNGNIRVTQPAGLVLLTNQFSPNTLPGTISIRGNVDTSTRDIEANGGDIRVYGRGDIAVVGSDAQNRISIKSSSDFGNAGNGGSISFATNSGKISLDNSNSDSYSLSRSGNAGNGGTIHLSARRGTILGSNSVLNSFAVSELGGSGNGGKVTLEAGSRVFGLTINTIASGGNSGDVEVNGFGDLLIDQTDIRTAQEVEVKLCQTCSPTPIALNDRGQAGNVAVTSTGSLTFSNSAIQSDTRGGNPAGSITITSPGIVNFNNSQIISNTNSTGQAGNITLKVPEIQLDSSSSLSAQTSSSGTAGNLTLQPYDGGQTLSVLFQDGAQISVSTSNQGTGGNITITAPDSVTIQGQGTITTSTTGSGNAGNITLDTSTLTIAEGAQLFAFTEGSGDSGTITVNAPTAVNLGIGVEDFSPVLSVETRDAGQAGSIIINTPSLTLSDTASITATATSTATNTEGGGSITLNASNMNLAGVVGVFAETEGQTPAGTLTLQPYENQSTLNLTLAPGAEVFASTSGSGKGGNLIVRAPAAITIQGPGQLAVQTTGDGAAGELTIDTQRLTITDGATISASTSSANPEGTGGSIIINATESFNLSNQASLSAQSSGGAAAGSVTLNTPNLTATNGAIATFSEKSSGGDITITASNIRLFGNSDITTRVNEGEGRGGDIDLEADSILAFDDSDILAFAPGGTGGNITLLTPAFFGENYRPAPRNTNPDPLDGNGRVGVNASGTVNGVIIEPDVSFIQNSLTELPSNQIDTDSLLANSCIVRRHQPTQGSFTITGTGGLPQRPGDAQMSSFPTVDIETLPSDSTPSNTSPNRPWQKGDPIVEPQGVYRLPNGNLVMSRECS